MQNAPDGGRFGVWKSLFWIVLCCTPMIAIIVLIALGYWSVP